MKKYLVRIQVDTWIMKLLKKVGLVMGFEQDRDDKHFVALFIGKWDDFVED